MLKIAALALVAALLVLTLRKDQPAFAFLVSVGCAGAVLVLAAARLRPVLELVESWAQAAGAFDAGAILRVLGICLAPFLQLGVHYLAYKFTAALSAAGSGGRIAGLIDQIGGAFGLVLGMTGSCALLLLISMVSAVTAAGG